MTYNVFGGTLNLLNQNSASAQPRETAKQLNRFDWHLVWPTIPKQIYNSSDSVVFLILSKYFAAVVQYLSSTHPITNEI